MLDKFEKGFYCRSAQGMNGVSQYHSSQWQPITKGRAMIRVSRDRPLTACIPCMQAAQRTTGKIKVETGSQHQR